jgi:hypothetical protein
VRERPCEKTRPREGGSVRKRSWAREALREKGPADRSCEDGPREWSVREALCETSFALKRSCEGSRQRRPAKIVQHRDLAEKVQQSTCCRICVLRDTCCASVVGAAKEVLRRRRCKGGAAKETGLEPLYRSREDRPKADNNKVTRLTPATSQPELLSPMLAVPSRLCIREGAELPTRMISPWRRDLSSAARLTLSGPDWRG